MPLTHIFVMLIGMLPTQLIQLLTPLLNLLGMNIVW